MNKIINNVLILDTNSRKQLKKEGEIHISIDGYIGFVRYDKEKNEYTWTENEWYENVVIVKKGTRIVKLNELDFETQFGNNEYIHKDVTYLNQKKFDRVC